MRDQYAGDISDFLKFAFLSAISGNDRRLGIAWYYVPVDDRGPDGRHLEWRNEEAWRNLNEELHLRLATLPERSIAALERAGVCRAGTLFHSEPVPRDPERAAWSERQRAALDRADLIFLDPDNGIGRTGEKHATHSEIRKLQRPGRAIAFISFPGRGMTHKALIERLHRSLKVECDATSALTLRSNVSVPRAPGSPWFVQRQRWFTVIDPDDQLVSRAKAFASDLSGIPRARALLDYMA